jgi:glutathione S-transferase
MLRTLYLTYRSPFARKVRILLLEKGLEFDERAVDLTARSAEFVAKAPLGKVPVLIDTDGTTIFDSSIIAEYLEDRYPAPAMLGQGPLERLAHRSIDELADAAADQAILLFMKRGTEADLVRIDKLVDRALLELELRIERGGVPPGFGLAHAAIVGMYHYVAFRLGSERFAPVPALRALVESLETRPSVANTVLVP